MWNYHVHWNSQVDSRWSSRFQFFVVAFIHYIYWFLIMSQNIRLLSTIVGMKIYSTYLQIWLIKAKLKEKIKLNYSHTGTNIILEMIRILQEHVKTISWKIQHTGIKKDDKINGQEQLELNQYDKHIFYTACISIGW